jgi:hypothetical protein
LASIKIIRIILVFNELEGIIMRFGVISKYLKEELGSDNVTMIFADSNGHNLYMYSNKALDRYSTGDGVVYCKSIPLSALDEDQRTLLKENNTKFYPLTIEGREGASGCIEDGIEDHEWRELRYLDCSEAETGLLSVTGPYAYCRSRRLAKYFGGSELDFPEEFLMVHESAHGLIDRIGFLLEDLFGDKADVVEETVSQLIGIKYLEQKMPEAAMKYKSHISGVNTDPVHMEAFDIVLNDRNRAEAMQDVVKTLIERNI